MQSHSRKHLVYTEKLIIDIKTVINYVYLRSENHHFGNILLIFNKVAFNKITRVANMEQLGQTN